LREGFITGYFPSLTYGDFRNLWVWAFVSNIGTWVHNVALSLYVHDVYHSPGWLGTVNFFSYLPVILFFLLAGSLVDTRNRKRVLMISQGIMLLAALALAIQVQLGTANLPAICITTFMLGVGFAFNFPAWQAIVPDLVPSEHLLNAVSLNAASFNLARSLGPVLASVIIAFVSFSACFFLNSASFLPFILALAAMSLPKTTAYHTSSVISFKTVTAGISRVLRRKSIRNLLLTMGIINFFGLPYTVFLPVFGKDILKQGDIRVSMLYAAAGLGAALGAPLITRLNRTVDETTLIRAGVLGIGLSLMAFSWSPSYWITLPLVFITGLSFLASASSINTILQLKTEREMRGRVMSIYVLMMTGSFPVGGALLGFIGDQAGMHWAMSVGALACLLWGGIILFKPDLLKEAPAS